jgi:hypothetical protein
VIESHLRTEFVLAALDAALAQRRPERVAWRSVMLLRLVPPSVPVIAALKRNHSICRSRSRP